MSAFCGGVVTNATEAALNAALVGGGTVTFDCDGTITLTSTKVLTNGLVLDGTGHNVVISGGNAVQLFRSTASAIATNSITLINLTLANGKATNYDPNWGAVVGGAVSAGAVIYAYNCTFTNNVAQGTNGPAGVNGGNGTAGQKGGDAWGGAIANIAGVLASNCVFVGNEAIGGQGGTGGKATGGSGNGGNGGAGGNGLGGAVLCNNGFLPTNCIFVSNEAIGGNGGQGGNDGTNNTSQAGLGGAGGNGSGGAVYSYVFSYNSTYYGNEAYGGNAGLAGLGTTTGKKGAAGGNAYGGAVYMYAYFWPRNVTFYENVAAGGNGGSLQMGTGGGGNGGNGYGGGVYVTSQGTSGYTAITNCTLSSNGAYGGAAGVGYTNGIAGQGLGGNLRVDAPIYTNTCYLKNSILAYASSGGNASYLSTNSTIVDGGENISSDGSITLNGPGSRMNTDPLLASLAYNGGFTPTCALMSNSPAIDAADPTVAPPTDQRGYYRFGPPDIGAYEYNGQQYSTAFVSVQAAAAYATEANPNTAGIFAITRTENIGGTNTVGLVISGTAVAGTDYSAVPTNVVLYPGVTQINVSVTPLANAPVGQAKTVVMGIIPSTNFMLGLYTNAVVTLVPPSSTTNSVASPVGRYWRGSGSDPTYWSQVIPLDYETGTVFSNTNGNCSSLYPGLTSWLNVNLYHYNATNALTQTNALNRIAFNNPIVAFGERVGGTPLYLNQPYRFGIYAGDLMPLGAPVVINVFSRTNYALAGYIFLYPPDASDTNSWNSYVNNGFEVYGTNYLSDGVTETTNNYGLTTTLSDTPNLTWGAVQPGAYVLTHTANNQATNYYYIVDAIGWLDNQGQPVVQDTNGEIQASLLYSMEFEPHPAWRSVFLDQPHFDGAPLPPYYAGMTLAEMLTNTPPVTNVVNFTPSAATNLDDSPELRRSPLLDNFVASMGNDPIALANYVINQIGLSDPMDYNDDGNIAEQSINPPGVTRGALGTFLEKQGSPVEQCALLVYLLRQAGVPAVYEFAPHNGLDILDARLSRMLKFQVHGGYSEAGQLYTTNTMIPVNYPWVAAYIGTNWVHIFPWLKDYEITEGLDLWQEMPTNYNSAYPWVHDYIYGNTNLLSLAVNGDSTPLTIFPAFLQQTLLQNHPGVSVDDIGVQIVNRQHYYARWQDFPTPTWVTNVSTSVESLSSSAITNVDPSLTNIFDTLSVEVYSLSNPNEDIRTGDLRLCDLHNREFYIYQSATNSGQVQLNLVLVPFRTNITAQASFTNDPALLDKEMLSMTLGQSDDQLKVRFRYHRHRAISPAYPIDPIISFLGFGADEEIDFERPLRKGDQAAICLNYGQVTRDMLNVHAQDLWQMENQLAANPALTNSVSPDVYEGALMYLAGMTYYEKVSEFNQLDESLNKINTVSFWAAGLSKISPARDNSGNLAGGNVDPVLPNVDMFFYEVASIGNGTVKPNSGVPFQMAEQNYNLMLIADGSAEEYQAIDDFYQQTNAVSTVRLLQLAQSGGASIVPLNVNNYATQGAVSYQGQPLENWDSDMWSEIVADFQGSDSNYVTAYITPGPMGNSAYSGMGALVLGWSQWQALISPQSLNGGFGEDLPDQTVSPINTINYNLQDNNGDLSIALNPPASQTTLLPTEVANFDTLDTYNQILNGTYAYDPSVLLSANNAQTLLGLPSQGTLNQTIALDFLNGAQSGNLGNPNNGGSSLFDKIADPVRPITGEFYVDATDLQLPGPLPLALRRNYSSQNLAANQFGVGWKLNIMPYLSVGAGGTNIYAADMDGAVLAYVQTATNATVWLPTLAANPQLNNNTTAGVGGLVNRLRDRLVQTVNGSTTNYTLYGADGSVRVFQVLTFNNGILNQTRPYLQKWTDNRGNYYTFTYGTDSTQPNFGQVTRIQCSNGNYFGFDYDIYGHMIDAYTGDGRWVYYTYDNFGDLIQVTLPDESTCAYQYLHGTQAVTNNGVVSQQPYSTHLIIEEDKPDGRELINAYDNQNRVTNQLSTAGVDLNPIRTGTFIYANNFNITNSYTNAVSGYTLIIDGNNHTNRYDYTNSLITKITDPLGQTIQQIWYPDNATAPGYPRSVQERIDKRGLITQFQYDSNGNVTNTVTTGDLIGDGNTSETATNTAVYNSNCLPLQMTDPAGNSAVYVYDPTFTFLPQQIIRYAGATPVFTNFMYYGDATNVVVNGNTTQTNEAFGLLTRQVRAYSSPDAATNDTFYNGNGFPVETIRYAGTGDPNVTNYFFYNERGDQVIAEDALGAYIYAEYDPLDRPTVNENVDEFGNLLAWNFIYYNENGEVSWTEGPRYNPENYVFYDYDGAGRVTTEIHWRSEAKSNGTGVEAPSGYNLYAQTFNEYDPLGNLLLKVDPRGAETTNTYDALCRLVQTKHLDTDGTTVLSTEGYGYEPGGEVEYFTNALGGVTTTLYTTTGKPEFQSNPDGSTNAWRYYLDGRIYRQFQRNGAYWQTTYDDADRITTRVFYSAAGVSEATNSVQLDRRGNIVQKVDADNNAFDTSYDGLDRVKDTAGPAIVTVTESSGGGIGYPGTNITYVTNVTYQAVTNFYDSAGRVMTSVNALGEQTVTTFDALKRVTSTKIYNSDSSLARETYTSYSPDHNSVTVTDGSGTTAISHTTYTDNDGHTVLSVAYPSSGTLDYTLEQYDLSGNLNHQEHDTSASGTVTEWTFADYTHDGLNRVTSQEDRDGAETYFAYDSMSDLTNRTMPGGLQWQANYNNAGQVLHDQLVGSDSSVTRSDTYTYYSSGSPFEGLLDTKTDGRGLVSTHSYDDWLRPTSITRTISFNFSIPPVQMLYPPPPETTNTFPSSDYNHLDTFYSYDARGYVTNITEQYTGSANGPDPKVVSRTYDAYGQLASETITINGAPFSTATQSWDAAGRRTGLSINGANYNFASRADGALTYAADSTGSGGYTFDTAGLLTSRVVGAKTTTIISRDGEGRPYTIVTDINGVPQLTESLSRYSDGLLADDTLYRGDFTDTRVYGYANLSRRLTYEQLNLNDTATWTNQFAYDNGVQYGPGVLTQMGVPNTNSADWSASVTSFSSVNTETNTAVNYPAYGRLNGQATVTAYLDNEPLSVNINDTGDTNWPYQWSTKMELTPGGHQLKVAALHPSGFYTAYATNSFTNNLGYETDSIGRDGGGNVERRWWYNAHGIMTHSQFLYWDTKGRLIELFDYYDNNLNGIYWHAEYDGLNRRLLTECYPLTNGVILNGVHPTTINQYYDPQAEFLELGVSVNNAQTQWKLYGPDLSGTYGGMNGVGGLDAVSPYLNTFNPLISDLRGDILGEVTNGMAIAWNPARPTGYGAVPSYRPPALGHGADVAQASAWRGHWPDITGYYQIGRRLYDPVAGMWLSYDSAWNEQDPNYLSFCSGDPINGFDSDGRINVSYYLNGNGQNSENSSSQTAMQPIQFSGATVSQPYGANVNATSGANGQSTSGGSYETTSLTLGTLGLSQSIVQYGSGGLTVGENGWIYTSGFQGNQYVSTAKIANVADKVALPLAFFSTGVDVYGAVNGNISWTKAGVNTGVTGVALFGGWPGAVIGGEYFMIDIAYPGGWPAFLQNSRPAAASFLNSEIMVPGIKPFQP